MLEKLDSVDWAAVEHAYGPAAEVPALVRDLTSKKAPERRKALATLGETINHQGTITPAAVAAAPFLVEIALAADTKDRGPLLAFLANLAVGGDHIRYVTTGYETRDAAFEQAPADFPYKVIHLAIDAAAAPVAKLLDHKEAATRVGAAMLLAFLARHADASAAALRARLATETDDVAAASELLALGILDRMLKNEGDAGLFLGRLGAGGALAGLAAAVALALAAPSKVAADAEQALLSAIANPPVAKDFPWCDGALDNLAGIVFAGLVAGRGDAELAGRLLAATAGKPSQGRVASLLLDAVIPMAGEPARALRPVSDLAPAQTAFLKQLIDANLVPRIGPALAARGLLDRGNDLARSLGLRPQGPVDREVNGEPLWRTLLYVVGGTRTEVEWLSAVGGLTSEEVVAVCEDASVPPYMLALPWPSPLDRPWSVERSHKERFEHALAVALCARATSDDLLAAGRRAMGKTPPQRPLCAALSFALSERAAKAGETLDPELDALVANGLDEGGHAADLRVVLERLPVPRRDAIVAKASFLVSVKSLPTGETAASLRGAWLLLDLTPTEGAVERAIAAIKAWTYQSPAFEEQASSILTRMGNVARVRLESELGQGATPLARIAAAVLSAPAA